MDFLNSSNIGQLYSILGDVGSIQDSQIRRSFLSNCGVGNAYWKDLPPGNASINHFVHPLINLLSEKYEDNLDPPIWGFIKKKPVLITFLENLINFDEEFKSDEHKEFIVDLVRKWRPWYEGELSRYYTSLSAFHIKLHKELGFKDSGQAQTEWDRLRAIQSQLKLGEPEFNEIWFRIQKDEHKREDERGASHFCKNTRCPSG